MEKYQISETSAKMLASAINEGRILATVKSVASSGMSRKMKFAVIKDNMVFPMTHNICSLLGKKETADECISMRGVGQNMIIHTIETAAYYLTKQGYPCKYHGYEQI